MGHPAPGKNGNEKLGNQFTVNGIHLKEALAYTIVVVTHCVLCLLERLLTSQVNKLENERFVSLMGNTYNFKQIKVLSHY